MIEKRLLHLSIFQAASLIFVGLLAAGSPISGQDSAAEDATFFETVDVQVVNVEVFVTDKKGTPIGGLTLEDFEVLEDGKPVSVTNFYAVEGGTPIEDPTDLELPEGFELPEGEELPGIEERPLSLIIYIDHLNITPLNRNRVIKNLKGFITENIQGTDRVMLVTNDGTINIRQPLTADSQALNTELEAIAEVNPKGMLLQQERRLIIRDIERTDLDGGGGGQTFSESTAASDASRILSAIRVQAQREYEQIERSTEALKTLVDSLAGVGGRKAVLYVSDGLSRKPGEALFYAWENKFIDFARQLGVSNIAFEASELDATPLFERFVDHSNANQVTFYAIGAAGSKTGSAVDPEIGGFDPGALSTPGGGRAWTAALDSIQSANVAGSLDYIATATGGRAMTRSFNFDLLLGQMQQDFETYYSLGYTPDRATDGKTHRIEVRLRKGDGRDKNWKVRHRERYRAKTRDERMTDNTLSALLLEVEANPLGVIVEFGRAEADNKIYKVPIMVKVPMSNLVLIPQGEVHTGKITIFVGVRDSEGRMSPVQSIPVPIRIPNSQLLTAMGQVAGYRVALQMRADEHAVAVTVHDDLGNVDSVVRNTFNPAGVDG